MPAHAAPLPEKVDSPDTKKALVSGTTSIDQSYFSGSPTPHGESLQTVPEEPSSTESSRVLGSSDGTDDIFSPRSLAVGPSVATLEAEIAGHATLSGKPMFAEPEFGPGPVLDETEPPIRPDVWRRSPGSFSAVTSRESETVSPTER
jgi:hypothetical protein